MGSCAPNQVLVRRRDRRSLLGNRKSVESTRLPRECPSPLRGGGFPAPSIYRRAATKPPTALAIFTLRRTVIIINSTEHSKRQCVSYSFSQHTKDTSRAQSESLLHRSNLPARWNPTEDRQARISNNKHKKSVKIRKSRCSNKCKIMSNIQPIPSHQSRSSSRRTGMMGGRSTGMA